MHRLVTVKALTRRLSRFGDWSIATKLATAPLIVSPALVLQWWEINTTINWLIVGAGPKRVFCVEDATQLSTMAADFRTVNAALYTVLTTRATASEGGGSAALNAVQAILDKLIADNGRGLKSITEQVNTVSASVARIAGYAAACRLSATPCPGQHRGRSGGGCHGHGRQQYRV